jgi:DNA-binding response OmpR family regulator
MERLLLAEGLEVTVVADGSKFFQSRSPDNQDLILLDVDTAGLDLRAFVAQLRKKSLRTPLIVISAGQQSRLGESPIDLARGSGAVGYFSKPVDGHALVDAIRFTCG